MFSDEWLSSSESLHEPGSDAPLAGANGSKSGARRQTGAVPRIHRALSSDAARGGCFGGRWTTRSSSPATAPRRTCKRSSRGGFHSTYSMTAALNLGRRAPQALVRLQ